MAQVNESRRKAIAAKQDIGFIPPIKSIERRIAAEESFKHFCETYYTAVFVKPWSQDHLKVIRKIERAVVNRDRFAVAMPRGNGKSSLCLAAVAWAVLTGKHHFVYLIASCAEFASNMLTNLKQSLQTNKLLLEDFPEVIYPIVCLEGQSLRCAGQRFLGHRTQIKWGAEEVVLPTIPGSPASGAIVRMTGILGNVRGAQHVAPDGSIWRPTLAILDDPQTDQSAKSRSQCRERLKLTNGAVAGLAGPGDRCGIIIPCTVIQQYDYAYTILDDKRSPLFNGEKTKLLYRFPSNAELWSEYKTIRENSVRSGARGEEATEFYRKNRKAMDKGARVAWEHRYTEGEEISAIQHAMNLLQADEESFWSEYQNEPVDLTLDEVKVTSDDIATKQHGAGHCVVPLEANHLTCFIDVQGKALYYMVVAWSDHFDGYIIDYQAYPRQNKPYYTLKQLDPNFETRWPNYQLEGRIYAALGELTEDLLGREWLRTDGVKLKMGVTMIDANWGRSTTTVRRFCRDSNYIIYPAHGRYVGATSNPFENVQVKPPNRRGDHWRTNVIEDYPHVLYDTNYWKSFVHSRLQTPLGESGCYSSYRLERDMLHRMLGDQLTAEHKTVVEAKGRKVEEWIEKPDRPDNHFFDCIVGCSVAASAMNLRLKET